MAIGSFLIFLALLVLVALFVARPLLDPAVQDRALDREVSHWLAERERVVDALAELDADWNLDKVPQDLYLEQRGLLLAKGAIALEKLEKIQKPAARHAKQLKAKKETDDDLEELIAAYRTKRVRRK